MSDELEAELKIGNWYSKCGHCRGNADPNETHHVMQRMHPNVGCGARFTSVSSDYGDKEAVLRMRPDLPYVGFDSAAIAAAYLKAHPTEAS